MAKRPGSGNSGAAEEISEVQARVERLELEAREWDARSRILEARARVEQLKAANPRVKKSS
jgi:hypothetical protein